MKLNFYRVIYSTLPILFIVQRYPDNPIYKWLNNNSPIIGLLLLIIGSGMAVSGIYELYSGGSRDSDGNVIEGNLGKLISIVQIVTGTAACAIGAHTIAR